MKKLLIALLFSSSANIAYAETITIDFNGLQSVNAVSFNSYTEDGYLFTPSNAGQSDALAVLGTSDFRYAGSPAMSIAYWSQAVTLTRIDNQLFDLTSIDLASYYGSSDIPSISATFDLTLSGTFADNSVISQTVTISNANTLSTYNLTGFNNLKSVKWVQGIDNNYDNKHQFDNLVLSSVAPVPEPETYAMFLAGLGLMGFVARRKKSA